MGYKIKKSILAGTSGHRKALNLAKTRDNLILNKGIDKSSNKDGRAKSSAFQLTEDDKKRRSKVTETWKDPTTTTTVTDNEKGGKDTTIKTDREGTRTTTTENEAVFNFKRDCYKNGVFLKGQTVKGMLCEKSKDPNYKEPGPEVKKEPLSKSDTKTTSTEKKQCECMAYNANNEEMGMVKHPCGEKNPNCHKRPTTPPPSDPGPSEDCKKKPGYARRKLRCENGTKDYKPGTWDDHFCHCVAGSTIRKKVGDIGTAIANCPKPRIKWGWFKGKKKAIGCEGVDGGISTSMN